MTEEMRWTLDALYDGFDGEAFRQDLKKCDVLTEKFSQWAKGNLTKEEVVRRPKEVLEEYITQKQELSRVTSALTQYAALVSSAETGHAAARGYLESVQKKTAVLAGVDTRLAACLTDLADLEGIIGQSSLLTEHRFFLTEIRRLGRYRLSEPEETVVAQLQVTGSRAWAKLHETLTAGLVGRYRLGGGAKVPALDSCPQPGLRRRSGGAPNSLSGRTGGLWEGGRGGGRLFEQY